MNILVYRWQTVSANEINNILYMSGIDYHYEIVDKFDRGPGCLELPHHLYEFHNKEDKTLALLLLKDYEHGRHYAQEAAYDI